MRALVHPVSIAALLHLFAGQSGTQDYETSSHAPLPRTLTCTTCECWQLLPSFSSAPCAKALSKVLVEEISGREGVVSKEREKQMSRKMQWAMMQDGMRFCWAVDGFRFLITALALMAAPMSSASQ